MNKETLAGLILMTGLIWTILDILVYFYIGTEWTLSHAIHTWLGVGNVHSNRLLLAGFTIGFLTCHLFGWTNRPDKEK